MREEIAYREMQEEIEREKQNHQAADPAMKDQQSAASPETADPTRKEESS